MRERERVDRIHEEKTVGESARLDRASHSRVSFYRPRECVHVREPLAFPLILSGKELCLVLPVPQKFIERLSSRTRREKKRRNERWDEERLLWCAWVDARWSSCVYARRSKERERGREREGGGTGALEWMHDSALYVSSARAIRLFLYRSSGSIGESEAECNTVW